MNDIIHQNEIQDQLGSQVWYAATIGTTSAAFPAIPGNTIIEVEVKSLPSNGISTLLYYSIDDVVFHSLLPGEAQAFRCRGGQKQIWLKANTAGVSYETKIAFEQIGEVD